MGYDRIFCIFQPHTYSRTGKLFNNFASALSGRADEIILSPIYSAREVNTGEVSSEMLADAIRKNGQKCSYFDTFEEIAAYVNGAAKDGDMILVMGAGDVIHVAETLTKA